MPRRRSGRKARKKSKRKLRSTVPQQVLIGNYGPADRVRLQQDFGLSDEQLERMEAEVEERQREKDTDREVLWQRYVRALMRLPFVVKDGEPSE
jgi:hypothetical protein